MILGEMLGLAAAVLVLVRLAQTLLNLRSSDPSFRPGKPFDPRLLRDPITMSWDEPERQESK